ncbi:hypothetical protein V8J82_07340 [Gymnodinialimonas sp. 2305UL16-5]|uniref:hypothetical protein n=1 Tax=Gymnodinialimonas mytili TaxID=3126503 RepID=UPI00309CA368
MNYDHMLDTILEGQVPCTGFGHAAHLGAAHAALRRWPFFEAAFHLSDGLRKTAAAAGAPEKFNATVTLAFLSLVAERMGEESSEEFVARHADLTFETLLQAGYDRDRLTDPKARDIAPPRRAM